MTTQVLFKPGHHDKSIPSGPSEKKRSLFDHTTADTEDELLLKATVSDTQIWETTWACKQCVVMNLWVCAAACCVFIFRVVSWKKHANVIDGGRLTLPIDCDSD